MKKNYLFIIVLFLSSLYSYAQDCTVSITSSDTDNIICADESVTFTATATSGALYQWRVNGVNVGPNSSNTTFTPAIPFQNDATVTVTLTPNTAGCTGSAITSNTITTTVNPIPLTPTAGNSSAVCSGGTISLTASNITGATYSWTGPNSFTSTLQNPTISGATAAMAGIYSVKATVAGCSSSPATTTVTVNSVPSAPSVTSNIAVCIGESITLSATSISGATYLWTGPNGFTSALQNPTIIGATTSMAGNYSVKATVANCTSVASLPTAVVVNPLPSAPAVSNKVLVCVDGTINLAASFITDATYLWTGPNSFTSTLQNPTIANATAAMGGVYSVKVTLSGCSSNAATTLVIVNAIPTAPTVGSNSAACVGGSINLTANTISGATYSWSGPNSFTSNLQNPTITGATAAMAGNYYVTATVVGCTSVASAPVVVVVNAIPSAPMAANGGAVCVGGTINLNASPIPGATYLWTGPNSFSSNLQNPTISGATLAMSGNYSVKVTVLGCTSAASSPTLVTVNAIPAAPGVVSNSPVCIGGAINLTANPIPGATYLWSGPNGFTSASQNPVISGVTATMAGTYSVTATVAGCTSNAGSTTIVVNPAVTPSVTITSNSTSICSITGITPVTFKATPTNGGSSPSYQWQRNGTNITGANSSLYTTSLLANLSSISVIMTSNALCASPASATSNNIVMTAYAGTPDKPATPTSAVSSVCPVASGIQLSVPAVANATTYKWNIPTGWTITAGDGTNAITLSVNGTASDGPNDFTVRSGNACGYSQSSPAFKIKVDSFAAVNAGTDQTICSGNNVELAAILRGNAATITWTSSNGGSFSNLNSLTSIYTPSITSGTVTLTATTNDPKGDCNGGTDQVIITVNQPPAITAQPVATQTLCSGSTATFSVVATGTGLTYQWQKSGVNIPGATSAILTLNAITITDDGDYTVKVSGASPCTTVTSAISALKVNQIVAITTQPVAQTLCSGSTATFNVIATGTGLAYQWQKAGTDIAGATSASFSINAVSSTDAGNYNVLVSGTSPCSAVTSATAALVINDGVTITTQPIAQTVCSGSNVTFNVVATGTGLTYQWQKAGSDIPGATAATLTLNAVNTSDAGNYTVKITGASPCTAVTSAPVALTVNQSIAITTQPISQTACSGTTTTFSVAATGSGVTYQWLKAGSAIAGATSNSFSINAVSTTDAADYSVIVSGINPCSPVTSATVTLTVNEIVAITAQPVGQTLCSGGTATFNVAATGTGLTYQWKKAGVDIAGATSAFLTINSISVSDSADYTVTVNGVSPCAAVTSSKATLVVNQQVSITTQPSDSQTVCSGFPASFSVAASGTGLSYEWFKNGISTGITTSVLNIRQAAISDAGTYTVVVKGVSPCTNVTSNNAVLTVNQEINITSQPTAKANCEGDTTTFEVTATGSSLNYVWRKGGIPIAAGGNISGESTATLTITGLVLTNAGSYDVVVSGSGAICAQTISTPALLTINKKSADPTSASATAPVICSGGSTLLNLTGGGGGTNEVIKWYSDSCGGTLVGTGNGFSVSPTTSTTYYGRYENTGTCPNNSACAGVTVTVNYDSTISLSSANGTETQAKCINTAIIPITYTIVGGGTTASITAGALPTGVTGLYSGGIFTISGTPTVAGTFNYTVTTAGLCANVSLSGIITVNPDSTLTLTSAAGTDTQTKCINNTITPITYAISAAGTIASITTGALPTGVTGVLSAGVFTISGTPSVSGIFNYTLTTAGLCNNVSLSGTLTVNQKSADPTSAAATLTAICSGQSTALSLVGGGGGTGEVIKWYTGSCGGTLAGTGNNLSVSPTTTTTYFGRYEDAIPCSPNSTCATVTITVNQKSIDPTSATATLTTICNGQSTSLSLVGGGGGTGEVIKWYSDTCGGTLAGNGNNLSVSPTTTTIYYGRYENAAPCSFNSNCATVTITVDAVSVGGAVTVSQPTILPVIKIATECHSGSGTLYLSGHTGSIMRWESSTTGGVSWTPIVNTGTTFNYTNILATTLFRAVIQNASCTQIYSAASIINVIPNIKPSPVSATPSTICSGESTILSSQSGYATSQYLATGGAFDNSNPSGWLVDGCGNCLNAGSSNTNPNPFQLSASNGGTYSGVNYTSNGKFAIANGNFNSVLQTPVFTTLGLSSASLNFNQAHFLTAGASAKVEISIDGGVTYNTILAQYVGPSSQQPYNISTNMSIDLSAYLGQTNLKIRFNYQGAVGSSWAIDNIKIPDTPAGTLTTQWIDTTTNTIISNSNSTNITVSPTVTTTYAVTSFLNGCTSFGTDGTTYVTVTVNKRPIISASDTTICSDELTNISVSSTETGTSYVWSVVQTGVTGATENSVGVLTNSINQKLTTTGTASGTAIYTLIPTSNGCAGTAKTVTVTVNPKPTANIGPNQTICSGASANLSIALTGNAPWIITYSNGTNQTTVTTSTNPYIFNASSITATQIYTITALSDANCTPAKPEDLTGSTTVTVLNGTAGLWTGLVSNDWFDCNNWAGGLPSSTVNAQIPTTPSGSFGMPVINPSTSPFAAAYSNIASAQNLIIATGASVTMTAIGVSDLQISRDWKNSGVFIPGNGTVAFNGAAANQIQTINAGIKSDETFYNLITNNSAAAKGISVADGFELTVRNNLILTQGDLRLTGEAQLVQVGTAANPTGGSGKLLRDQQGQKNSFNYNYWSSPVSPGTGNYSIGSVLRDGTSITGNFTDIANFNPSTLNTISFIDGAYSADGARTNPITISTRWLWAFNWPALSDPWLNYSQWSFIGSATSIKAGEGFTMKGTDGTAAITDLQNYVFVGKPNSGTITLPLPLKQTYLVGNPYPSALDADELIKDNLAGRRGKNIFNGALYFWDHFGKTDNHVLAQYKGGYATYTLMGGVAGIANSPLTATGSGTKVPQRYIPVAQGFFVDANLDPVISVRYPSEPNIPTTVEGGDLIFKNSQRAFKKESAGISLFMKTNSAKKTKAQEITDTRSKIRLGFDSPVGGHRQLLLGADSNTTLLFDIGYDAPIFDMNANDMYWELSNSQFVIQAIPNFNVDQIIPLGVSIANEGKATIKIDALENISGTTEIYIHDNVTGIYHDIRKSNFTISLAIGKYKNRFSLQFTNKTLDVDENILNHGLIVLYSNNYKTLIIQNKIPDTTVKDVYLINLLGQTIDKWDVEDTDQTRIQLPVKNLASGVYIVKLKTTTGEMSKKIIIK